jgi:hypothetical protein
MHCHQSTISLLKTELTRSTSVYASFVDKNCRMFLNHIFLSSTSSSSILLPYFQIQRRTFIDLSNLWDFPGTYNLNSTLHGHAGDHHQIILAFSASFLLIRGLKMNFTKNISNYSIFFFFFFFLFSSGFHYIP